MRILITGVTGFAGGHLAETLLRDQAGELHGTTRGNTWPAVCKHLADRVQLHQCELSNREAVSLLLNAVRPERIYHLAGYADAGRSLAEPGAAWEGNLQASLNLYEALAVWGGRCRILHVSSGLIYGSGLAGDAKFAESAPLRPGTPYAASKAAADLAAFQFTRTAGLDIVRVRPFNHAGPRQSAAYALANFARQIAAIEKGRQPPIVETGDLDARRDITDVRDVVRAYVLAMANGTTGEVYNVGSGSAFSMGELLRMLTAGLNVRIEFRQKPSLLRTADSRALCADASLITQTTGWRPVFNLERTLTDILDYWRTSET